MTLGACACKRTRKNKGPEKAGGAQKNPKEKEPEKAGGGAERNPKEKEPEKVGGGRASSKVERKGFGFGGGGEINSRPYRSCFFYYCFHLNDNGR